MRLINASTHRLESFGESNTPRYAILSHRWGLDAEEVSFQDMTGSDVARATSKKGFIKIKETCIRALRHGLQYIWIDTCCIDKSSSAELTESINSMFLWYRNSEECIVYLSDLRSEGLDEDDVLGALASCTWFTRGWTLQELIAPKYIIFYNQSWEYFGKIGTLCSEISSITKIPTDLLLGKKQLHNYSVAARMSWAANRKTERTEDLAYCLLGIFDVNMPLIYGEGRKAFRRLQEEIIQRSNDLTIFAWTPTNKQKEGTPCSLFASSADEFASSNNLTRYSKLNSMFALTNKGLRIENFPYLEKRTINNNETGSESITYYIPVGFQRGVAQLYFGILLQKAGPDIFVRIGNLLHYDMRCLGRFQPVRMPHFFIQTDNINSLICGYLPHSVSIYIPKHANFQIQAVIPESHWDESRRIFFKPQDKSYVLALACKINLGESELEVTICINNHSRGPFCWVFGTRRYPARSPWSVSYGLGQDVRWHDLEASDPSIVNCKSWTEISANGKNFVVETLFEEGVVESISQNEIYSLNFQVKELSRPERKRSRKSGENTTPAHNSSSFARKDDITGECDEEYGEFSDSGEDSDSETQQDHGSGYYSAVKGYNKRLKQQNTIDTPEAHSPHTLGQPKDVAPAADCSPDQPQNTISQP